MWGGGCADTCEHTVPYHHTHPTLTRLAVEHMRADTVASHCSPALGAARSGVGMSTTALLACKGWVGWGVGWCGVGWGGLRWNRGWR